MPGEDFSRRPIAARDTSWARTCAAWLARHKVKPNVISVFSVVSAALGGACMLASSRFEGGPRAIFLVLAMVFIQGRLLCNLFDGMVAVEGGLKSKSGEIYNEAPDRVSDLIILVCAGYSENFYAVTPSLGWAAGCSALLTAYIRSLGASAGTSQQFCGPMAKQQRMFLVSMACLVSAILAMLRKAFPVYFYVLIVIIAGAVVTSFRRLARIISELENQ